MAKVSFLPFVVWRNVMLNLSINLNKNLGQKYKRWNTMAPFIKAHASQYAQGMMGLKGENRWLKAKLRVWFCNLKLQRINSCLENTSNTKVPDIIIGILRKEICLKLIPFTFALRILSVHDLWRHLGRLRSISWKMTIVHQRAWAPYLFFQSL